MDFKYTLIRSKRRTLALQINRRGDLIVRAPIKMSLSFIEDFLEQKSEWIEKYQKKALENRENRIQKKEYSPAEIQAMKEQLREYIIPRITELWQGKNLPKYTSIKITKSEHRWGSCSAKNGLCFSYRLAEYLLSNIIPANAPRRNYSWGTGIHTPNTSQLDFMTSTEGQKHTRFIDAIIIHELAHLKEKNHQKPFWNLVYVMMPEYEKIMDEGKSILL